MSTNIRVETRLTVQVREALRSRDGSLCAASDRADLTGQEEQQLLAQLVMDTLDHDLQPARLIRADGSERTGIEAWFDDGSMMVVAVESDNLLTDQIDASGECAIRQVQLEQGLALRGVEVRRTGQDDHGEPTGPLVQALAGSGRRNLAEAIAFGTRSGETKRPARARNRAPKPEQVRQVNR